MGGIALGPRSAPRLGPNKRHRRIETGNPHYVAEQEEAND